MKRLLVVMLALVAAGCSKCGKPGSGAGPGRGVETVLPTGATAYVIVPSVERLGQKLTQLEGFKVANFAVQAAGFETAHAYVDALVADLGIDLRSKEQLEKIGIAPDGSAGVALMGRELALVALPIKDEGRIGAFIRTFSANRLGASAVEDKVENGVTVHRLVAQTGAKLAWTTKNGFALVVSREGVDQLAGWAARGEADTLAKDTSLPASLGRLPKERDAIIYAPPGGAPMLALPVAHVVLTAALDAKALTLSFDAPWGGDPSTLGVFETKPGASLTALLPADTFLAARFGGDPSLLAPLAKPLLGEHLSRAFSEGGFDLPAVLQQVAPGTVMGLSLSPTAQMGSGVPDIDIRRTNPFKYVHLSGVAPARSAELVAPALAKLAEVAPRFGAQMTLKDGVYVTTYAQGEGVHFAAKGDQVVFGSPLPRVQALLAADGKAAPPLGELRQPLEGSSLTAVVDLRRLAASVRELPPSAWGVGGFAIKATTVRWLDNSDDLRAVTLSVGTKGGAVQGTLQLLLGAPAPTAAAPGDAGP